MARRSGTRRCSEHPTETLSQYCEDCRDLVCDSCAVLPPHDQHQISVAEKVLPKHVRYLEEYIVEINGHVQGTENLMDNLAETSMKVQENRSAAELRIRAYFNRIRNLLNERERHFVSAVRLDTNKKMELVSDRRSKIKVIMDTLIASLKTIDSFVRQPDDVTILKREGPVLRATEEHIEDLKGWYDAPPFDTTITLPCVEDRNFEEVSRLVGDPSFRTCPPGCTAKKGKQSNLVSQSPPLDGAPPPRPPKPKNMDAGFLSPELLAYKTKIRSESILSTDSVTSGISDGSDVADEQDNGIATPPLPHNGINTPPLPPKSPKYNGTPKPFDSNQDRSQSFTFNEPGSPKRPVPKPRGNVRISLSNIPAPPTMTVDPPTPLSPNDDEVKESGIITITTKQMLNSSIRGESVHPTGVATGSNGLLVVTDAVNGYVRLMTTTGKLLDCIGHDLVTIRSSKDSGDEYVKEPCAVVFDNSGQILILENTCILKFSNTGKFISKIVPKGRNVLGNPKGLALDHEGNMFVTDWDKMCVHVFDSSGKYLKQIANNQGRVSPQTPTGITIDGRGRVIITDYNGHHVWIYTPDGDLLKHFGWQGHTAGDIFHPYGVAVDSKANIFVSEAGNHRVSVFNSSCDFITSLGSEGSDTGQLKSPKHICIDKDKLIIADDENQRVQILDIVL